MNAINQEHEGDSGGVYGTTDMIECGRLDCKEVFKENKTKTKMFYSKVCKNAHHALEREAGKKVLAQGTIHAALLENSPRLQRVAKYLSDGKARSTMDIQIDCRVCGVPAIKAELIHPKNGFDIDCTREGGIWSYKMVGGQSQLLRII